MTFRAKPINGGEWVIGDYIWRADYNKHFIVSHENDKDAWHTVKPSTLGICLDMQDKSGKPIYASFYIGNVLTKGGSLVFIEDHNAIFHVLINSYTCQLVAKNNKCSMPLPFTAEVVGNYQDNKELL
jgi:hypothetical protein